MSTRNEGGKKLLCVLLTVLMLFCMIPSAAFASEAEDNTQAVSIDITVQDGSEFLLATQKKVSVSENLAEEYGYGDHVTEGVSALDALVKAHELIYGEQFNEETAPEYLQVDNGGTIRKIFAKDTTAVSFAVNGDYPYDPDSDYGAKGYTGYMVNEAPLTDGGDVEFFMIQDTYMYSDFYTYFEQNQERITEITASVSEDISLNLQGYIYAYGGAYTGQDRVNQGRLGAIEGAKIGLMNEETGQVTQINDVVTDENGDFTISFDKPGTYYVTAYGTNADFMDAPLIMTLLKVEVQTNVMITVPEDAEVFVGQKPGNTHFVLFNEMEKTSQTIDEDAGTKTVYYQLSDNTKYNFRISGEDYVTYTGIFTSPSSDAEPYNLTVTEAELKPEGKTEKTVEHDVSSNNNYNVADIYLNINERGHLELSQGEEYQIVNIRNWQTVDSVINNYFIEPDYNYKVIDFEGNESDVLSISDSGLITAEKQGTAVVLVTYDALTNISAAGGPFFGAIWPENTGAFIVTVDESSSTAEPGAVINQELNIKSSSSSGKQAGEALDAELDVIYYLTELTEADGKTTEYNESGSFTLNPSGSGEIKVEVANPTYEDGTMTFDGFNAVDENDDGSFTVSLTEGRNIVKVTDDNGSIYQVITAKALKAVVNNLTTPGSELKPGDSYSVVFDTVYHPVNKLSGVYNMSARITYSDVEGSDNSLNSTSNQYQVASNEKTQTISSVVPEDYQKDTLTLSEGTIYASGFGSPFGDHRAITLEEGKNPNFTASMQTAYFGQLPDIELKIAPEVSDEEVKSIEITNEPNKTEYFEGETFDPQGIELKVLYADGTEIIVTRGYSVSSEPLEAGTENITVSYGGVTAEVDITVKKVEVDSIEITTPPDKTEYTAGENFDIGGMVITAVYNNGNREQVTGYTYTGQNLTTSDEYVIISYGGKTVYQPIKVTESEAPADEDTITVLFTLIGDEQHGDNGEVHSYAEGTIKDEWISQMEVIVSKDAKVIDVITEALSQKGISYSNPSGGYITEINGLSEFDNGSNSGWMYTINGAYGTGIDQQEVHEGDIIVFHYTDDWSKENYDSGLTAAEAIDLIDGLPDVSSLTLADADAVERASQAFEALSDEDKALVSEIKQAKLNSAVLKIAELRAENSKQTWQQIYDATGMYIASIIEDDVQYGNEWSIIGLARAGKLDETAAAAYYDNIVDTLKDNGSAKLNDNKSTENSRVILALTAIGIDPTDVAGYNLLESVEDMEYVTKQGINGAIFALIAFDSHDYTTSLRQELVKYILDARLDDGGWALTGQESDPDITAMALQALAPYTDDEDVKVAVEEALTWLSQIQNADGGFSSFGAANSESCAQVITALTALGIDPATDVRFVKNGYTVMDALLNYALSEGFEHITGQGTDQMATEQAYYAMVAYERMMSGDTSLYDMSDVSISFGAAEDDNNGENGSAEGTGDAGNGGAQTGDGGQGSSQIDTAHDGGADDISEAKDISPEKTGDAEALTSWLVLAMICGAAVMAVNSRRKHSTL